MVKRRGFALLLAVAFGLLMIQLVSAVNVNITNYSTTKSLISIENADSLYSYEINFDYSGSSTVQQYNFLGTSPTATYGKTLRGSITSVYGSRLDSGLIGINGNGSLFNITYSGTFRLRYAYFIQNDSAGIYTYYNETPRVTINYPTNTTYGDTALLFNVTLTERNHTLPLNPTGSVSFSLNNGVTNYTMTSSDGIHFTYNYSSLTDGSSYVLRIYASDSYGNKNYTSNVGFGISVVAEPSCSDSIQNGDETGTDCGGSCDACPTSSGGGGGGGGGTPTGAEYTLETDTMARGLSKDLKAGDSLIMKIEGDSGVVGYTADVVSFNTSSTTINLNGKLVTLEYGVGVNFDLDGDGLEDIVLEANAAQNAVNIQVQQLSVTKSGSSGGGKGGVSVTKETPKEGSSGNNLEGNFVVRALKNFFSWLARLFGFE